MKNNPSMIRSVLGAKLSSELAKEYYVRSMPIRKGDTIIVMRGAFRDVEGKVTRADHKNASVYVEGVTKEKSDGSTIFLSIHPSNVMITKLSLEDKRRKDILERRASKPLVEAAKKPKIRAKKKSSKKSSSSAEEKKDKE